MQSDLRAALVFMCRRVLQPLVRVLIRFGISAGEFKAIVDSVYAHTGSEYLTSQGERVTYSRLAVITGINRSVLPGILATPQDRFQPRSDTQVHRAARVLTGWHDDAHFQTRTGEPALLPIRGGSRSFQELVHRYSGGVYFQTLLSELIRVGAVRRTGSRVRALRRSPNVSGANPDSLYEAGEAAGDLLATLEYNLNARTHEQLPVRSLKLRVDERTLPLFRAQVGKRADGMLEVVDEFLQSHQARAARRGAGNVTPRMLTLGATIFAVCRPDVQPTRRPTSVPRASARSAAGR